MDDPRSAECIVSDVSTTIEGGIFRWTYLKPTLQFHLDAYERQRFVMDFSVVERTFRDTGPVTLSVYINDRFLAAVLCSHPGDYHLERSVPASWLKGADPIIVKAILDRVWVAPADGARLGYILLAAGFRT
jgi:hypothetical protein